MNSATANSTKENDNIQSNLSAVPHFIDGKHYQGDGNRFGNIFDPSRGHIQGQVCFASTNDVKVAVDSAERAFATWSKRSPMARATVMYRYRDLIIENKMALARALSSEHGKTVSDSLGDIQRGLDVVEFACGIPHLLKGEANDLGNSGIDVRSYKVPLGVVAGITPFNFPAMIPMWMFAIAVTCGNTFILKPSEKDPTLPLMLADYFMQAGGPEGVLNVINGDKVAVDAILNEPRIKAVSFVGSTPIAKYVYSTGTANGKRVQAMGGAKNHAVIMPDANMDQVVDALIGAGYGSAGERCMALSVAVPVGEKTANELIEHLAPRVKDLNIKPPLEDKDMGPLVSAEHLAKVKSYIDIGIDEGAELVVDGRGFAMQEAGFEDGYYLGGCLFDHVKNDMRIYKEEIFGPVLSVLRCDNYSDALELPSSHAFGNGVAIFTQNGNIADHFAKNVEIGMVGINVPIPVPLAFHSFGGWKDSAFGDCNQHGTQGVHFYTRMKTITSKWPDDTQQGPEFTIPTHA